jgi:hypothetical protein
MDPQKEQEFRKRILEAFGDHRKIVETSLCVYFGDGNTDSDASSIIKSDLQFDSEVIKRDLKALETLLAEPDNDDYLLWLVGELVGAGARLKPYNSEQARNWILQKIKLIKDLFEAAVHSRGGKDFW